MLEKRAQEKRSQEKRTSMVPEKVEDSISLSLFEGQTTGFEGTDSSTFKTPFIKILQALSPELKKSSPEYVAQAEQGMFYNTASGVVSQRLEVVVLKVEHSLIVWRPERQGFVGRWPKSKEGSVVASREGLKKWDREGNGVMDTIELFCLDLEDSGLFLLPLSSSSFKQGRSFATRMRSLTLDGTPVRVSWAGVWSLETQEDSNDKGSWYTLKAPTFLRFISKEERDRLVIPNLTLLAEAETDYTSVASEGSNSTEEY